MREVGETTAGMHKCQRVNFMQNAQNVTDVYFHVSMLTHLLFPRWIITYLGLNYTHFENRDQLNNRRISAIKEPILHLRKGFKIVFPQHKNISLPEEV